MSIQDDETYFDLKSLCIEMDVFEFTVTDFISNPRIYYKPNEEKTKLVTCDEPIIFRLTKDCKVTKNGEEVSCDDWVTEFDSEFTVTLPSSIDLHSGTMSVGTAVIAYRLLSPVVDDYFNHLFQSASIGDINMDVTALSGLKPSDAQKARLELVELPNTANN